MRKFSVLFLLMVLVVSAASAELLTTANPVGKGSWCFMGAGTQSRNYANVSDYTLTTLGAYAGYGITDKLDAYLQLGSATIGGLPTGIEVTGTGMGATVKYSVLSEENMPVSVAVGAGYKSTSTKTKSPLGETTTPGSQILVGVGVSKVIVPFIPYGAIAYRKDSQDSTEVSTQMDITVGSAIAWSMQGAVYVEYTSQSITPNGGNNYSSGQIAAGVGYKI